MTHSQGFDIRIRRCHVGVHRTQVCSQTTHNLEEVFNAVGVLSDVMPHDRLQSTQPVGHLCPYHRIELSLHLVLLLEAGRVNDVDGMTCDVKVSNVTVKLKE